MKQWMTCTTCRRVVLANETGICLNCQGGFSRGLGADDYFMQQSAPRDEKQETIDLAKEKIDALEKRIEQIDSKREHQDGDETWKTTEAGRRHSPPNCS